MENTEVITKKTEHEATKEMENTVDITSKTENAIMVNDGENEKHCDKRHAEGGKQTAPASVAQCEVNNTGNSDEAEKEKIAQLASIPRPRKRWRPTWSMMATRPMKMTVHAKKLACRPKEANRTSQLQEKCVRDCTSQKLASTMAKLP